MSTTIHQTSIGDFREPSNFFSKTSLSSSNHAPSGLSFGTRDNNWGQSIWNSSSNGGHLGLSKSQTMNDHLETDRKGYRSLIDGSQSEDSNRNISLQQQNALPPTNSSPPLARRNPFFSSSHFGDYSQAPTSRTQPGQTGLTMSSNAKHPGNNNSFGSQDLNRQATQTNGSIFSSTYASSPSNEYSSNSNRYHISNTGWNALSNVPNSRKSEGLERQSEFDKANVPSHNLPSFNNGLGVAFKNPSTTGPPPWIPATSYSTNDRTSRATNMTTTRADHNQNSHGTEEGSIGDIDDRLGQLGISNWKSHEYVPSQRYAAARYQSSVPKIYQTGPRSPVSPIKQRLSTSPDSDATWPATNLAAPERSNRGLPIRTDSFSRTDPWEDNTQLPRNHVNEQVSNSGMSNARQTYSAKREATGFQLPGDANGFEMPNSRHLNPYRALSPLEQDQASILNAQVQQMLMSQLRAQYSRSYNYGMPIDLQGSGVPTYLPLHQMPQVVLPPMQPHSTSDLNGPVSLRSALLEEFKATNGKGTRGWELKDIYEYMVEFSGDQQGSRLIQSKLETANSEEKERVFHELLPNAVQLMQDVFGNYVIQKLFEHGDQHQKKLLAASMRGKILHLTTQVYGCRVVQKALEHVLVDEQLKMVGELEHHVMKCVKDQNGNHVIQRAIERIPSEHIQFIINAFKGQIGHLAIHTYGCRVVQRLLEWCSEPTKSLFLQELHAHANQLIADQYGNYVTQHVIQHGTEQDRSKLIQLVKQHLMTYSKQKFASNVVEKSLMFGTNQDRRDIMHQLCEKDSRGETRLPELIKDQYGNYVIQRILDTLPDHDYTLFVEILAPEMARAKRLAPNKHAEMIVRKMQKFGCPFAYPNDPSLSLHPISTGVARESPSLTTPRSSSVPSSTDDTHATSNTDALSIKEGDYGIPNAKF